MLTNNLSILDRNIIAGLGDDDAYLRLRDKHPPLVAERLAYMMRDAIRPLLLMAAGVNGYDAIPAGLERFFVERMVHMNLGGTDE